MTSLINTLSDDTYVIAAAAAAFLSVIAVGASFIDRDTRSKRLRLLKERRAELRGQVVRERRKKPDKHVNFMRRVVNRFQLLKSSGISQTQQSLIEAGMRSKDALVIYMFFTLVLPIVFCMFGLALLTLDWGHGKNAIFRYATPIALTYVGLKIPAIVVSRRRKKRQMMIRRALPDTLDLMTICAEAGLTLSVAVERVSRELGNAYPEMAEELVITSVELGILPERSQAYSNLVQRVNIQEVRGVVNVLMQTEKYGTPVAQALRVLSAEFREQRMLAAENKAARLGPLMTLPMICFILPTMFVIVIAPAAIQLIDTLAKK